MKLHLPKPLRNSVLACIAAVAGIATPTLGTATFAGGVVAFTLASQQAMADWAPRDSYTNLNEGRIVYYMNGDCTVDKTTNDSAVNCTDIRLAPDARDLVATVDVVKLAGGDKLTVYQNPWKDNIRNFGALTIQDIQTTDEGAIEMDVQEAQTVILENSTCALSSLSNAGTLTLGKADGTSEFNVSNLINNGNLNVLAGATVNAGETTLSRTITSDGVLNLNGNITVTTHTDLEVKNQGSWLGYSDGENGFKVVKDVEFYLVNGGGNVVVGESVTLSYGNLPELEINASEAGKLSFALETSTSAAYYVNTTAEVASSTASQYIVKEGAVLKFTDALTTYTTLDVDGLGHVIVNFATGNHDKKIALGEDFHGKLTIQSGYSRLPRVQIGSKAILELVSGESWGDTGTLNNDVLLSAESEATAFKFIGSTMTFNGAVRGNYLQMSGGDVTIQNAASDIQAITVGGGTARLRAGQYDVVNANGGTTNLKAGTFGAVNANGGTVNINGPVYLGGPIVLNGATVNYNTSDGAKVALAGVDGLTAESTSSLTTNGLKDVQYTLLTGNGNGTTVADLSTALGTVTVGSAECAIANGVVSASNVFYVVEKDVLVTAGGDSATSGTASATAYVVGSDGVLKIAGNASDTMTVASMLSGGIMGTGTVELATNVTIGNNSHSVFAGNLKVDSDVTLSFGSAGDNSASFDGIDYNSISSIQLNGGTLRINYADMSLNSVEVLAAGSVLEVHDYSEAAYNAGKGFRLNKLNMVANGELKATWKSNIDIDLLTGSGDLSITRHDNPTNINIQSFKDYTGALSINGGNATVNAIIRAGETLRVGSISGNGTTLNLSGSGTYDLGNPASTALPTGVTLTDNWTGTVRIGGVDDYYAVKNPSDGNKPNLDCLDALVNEKSTVLVNGVVGWIAAYTSESSASVITANLQLENISETVDALKINNGSSWADADEVKKYTVFAGSISGDGNIRLDWNRNLAHHFRGDISGWTGVFYNAGTGKSIVVLDERATDVKVAIDRAYSGTVRDILLTVNNQATFANKVNVTSLTLGENAGITLAQGSSLEVATGGTTIGAGQSLATTTAGIVMNSALTFNGGSLTLGGALNLGGQTLTISTTNKTALTLADGIVGESFIAADLITNLSGIVGFTSGAKLGEVFSVADSLANLYLEYDESTDVLRLVSTIAEDRTWVEVVGAENGGTWKEGSPFGGTGAANFAKGDYAIFGALNANESVAIDAAGVKAGSVTIEAGEGKSYVFSGGALTTPKLTVTSGTAEFGNNTLQLASLSSATVANGGVLDLSEYDVSVFQGVLSKTTGAGTLVLNEGQVMLTGDQSIDVNTQIDGDELRLNANNVGQNAVVTLNKALSYTDATNSFLRLESGAKLLVADNGVLEVGKVELGHIDAGGNVGHLEIGTGGTVTAGSVVASTRSGGGTLVVNGGTLELTGADGIAAGISTTITAGTLVAKKASWGITGATIGGATVTTSGDHTITLTGATLTSTLDNTAGKLVLAGTIDITSNGYVTTTSPREYSNNGDGYAKVNTAYDVVTTVGNLTADGVSWTVDGSSENVSYANGVVTVAGSDWGTEYYVRSVDATLSGIAKANAQNEALTTIVLAGKDLNMNEALGNVRIRVEKEGESVVAVGGGLTLAASQVTGTDATHKLKLHGSGTYALTAGTATLGNGTVLGDWTGTVKVTNATGLTYFNIDALGNADSTVELTGVSGHLLATTADNETTYNTNLKLVDDGDIKALTLTNGWRDGTNVFAGDVSGSGSFVMASGVPSGMSVKFTGDLSEWDGAFVGNNTGKSVNLNIASSGNVGADIISQQGTLNVTFSGASTTMKGDIGYGTGVLNMTVAAGASVVMEGTLADNVALTSNGMLSLTQDTVSLASLGGTGSVSAKAMTLTGATYSMGDLKLTGALTLSESVTSLTTGKLNIAGGVNISSIASNLFSVSTIENGLTLNITEELLEGTLGTMEDKRVALLTLTGEFADTSVLQAVKDSVLLGAFDANGTAGQKQEGAMYDYELVWNGNTMELVASISASACTWVGGTDYSWDTAANWSSAVGGVPTADTAVFIKGDTLTARTNIALEKTVNGEVVGVDAEVKSLTIEAWGVRQPVNIGGMGSLSIGGHLTLQSGELALLADTSIGGNIIINNQSILKLAGMDPESAPTISVDGKLVNNFQMYVDGAEVTIEGDAANKGSLVVMGGSLEINGTTTNEGTIAVAGGSLSTGDVANTGNIIIDAGSMEVEGNLSHSGENSSIVVNSGSRLEVTGNLNAANMTLDFDGNVTVGGTATVGTLTNDGTFTAANATIGTLTNNGTLSVDKDGTLTITTLAGTGNVSVGVGGVLDITDDATFTGTVDNKGTVKTDNTMTLTTQTNKGGTVEAADLMVQAGANGSVFTSVTTDSITIETLDSGVTNLTTGALAGKTDESAVTLVVNQLTTEEGMNEIIGAGARDYTLLSIGGNAPEITVAELEYEREQQLWQSGLKLAMSGVSTMDLRARETKVGLSVQQQTEKEGTWNVGDATTGIGLEVVDSAGKLVNNNVLDNVQKVVVSGSRSIDMTGDISTAKLNKLTGTSSSKLTIAGDGMTKDTVTISKSSAYMGTLVLDGVTADFDLTGATVAGADGDTALSGKLTEGTLSVKQASTAQGKGLELIGSTVEVDITKDSMSLGTDALNKLERALVDLGDVTLDADTTVEIGTYDAKTGEFIKSVGYSKYFDMDNLRVEGGKVVADRNTTYYTGKLADSTSTDNGKIGLSMADEALLNANPQGATSTGDLAAVLDQLDAMVVTGNKAAADELGASLAGASTAVLGMAALGDVDRQLRAIRNRTTTMGVDQSVVNADMPYFNAWINAEGDSREMGDDGTLGGYKLNSYGGTVGFDVDIEPTLTAGMALTAMYGDLDTTGGDQATGNLDSYYVSAFARYCGSAWTHTFVGTIGKGDISLDRTVGGAQVKGETDSMSFGLMYEVGRVYAMDEDGTTCLQPVFNVTLKHTTVDAYTEKGGDVALNVDEQSLNTITFGLGARLQTVVGESMYNRTSIFECRLLAKADVGDTEGTSKVALGGLSSHEVKSNEQGAIGIEVGAGLTIPLGDEGSSIFMDASAEIRADYTDVNGTVGYRVNF